MRNYLLTFLLAFSFFAAKAQNCTALFGSSQEPAGGLTYFLCDTPTVVVLDATTTQGTATSYTWSTTSTTPLDTVSAIGNYTVTISSGGNPNSCILNFTVQMVTNNYSINIGNDTSICFGNEIILSVPDTFSFYEWNTGSIESSIQVDTSGIFSLAVTDSMGCIKTDTIQIDTLPLPTVSLGNDTAICVGSSITLDAGSGFTSYLWNTTASTQTINISIADTFSVEVTNSFGCTRTDTIIIDTNSLPAPTITGNDSACPGGTVTLDLGTGYASYLWSNNAITQTANYIAPNTNLWGQVTDANGCVGSDTFTVYAYTPDTVSLGNDTSFCYGDTITLDPGAGYNSYAWSNFTGNQTISVSYAGTYAVTVADIHNCYISDTIVVSSNPLPNPSLGNNLEYCQGSTLSQVLDLTSTAYTSYLWMDGTTTPYNTITDQDNLVWAEVTDTNNCTNRDSIYVVQNALPNVNIGADDTICQGQTKNLNPGTGGGTFVTYAWSNNASTQTVGITTSGTVSVTITDNNGCVSSDTMNLIVTPLPIPDLGNDTGFCQGSNFTITLDPGTFDSYSWNTTATTQTINVSNPAYGTYAVTVTDTNGCINTDNLTIYQYNLPSLNIGDDTSYCEGDDFNWVITAGNYDAYLWQDNSTSAIYLADSPGNYTVTVTDVNGCQSSDNVTVTENPTPVVDLGSNLIFCEDELINEIFDAGASTGPGMSYSWNTGSVIQQIIVTEPGTYAVTVTNNSTQCFSTDDVTVSYFPKADPNLGSDDILCVGEFITLDPSNEVSGYNYIWSTGATTSTIDVNQPGVYWVRLDAQNGTCVNLTDTIVLSPGTTPVIELGNDLRMCLGQQVIFNNDGSPQPNVEYVWQDGDESYEYVATETGLYTLTATNKCGSVVDNVYIRFDDCFNVYVPNTFTPNGDGKNETFKAISDQEFYEFNMWIFDRWGHVVWKTNNPYQSWDGTVNGDKAPTGLYVWKMDFIRAFDESLDRVEKVGHINLIR